MAAQHKNYILFKIDRPDDSTVPEPFEINFKLNFS